MGSCLSVDGTTNSPALPYAPVASTSDEQNLLKRRNSRKKISRRNPSSSASSYDSKMEMWLHRIPGRMFLNGSTNSASLFTKQGKKGVNQDAMIVWENFGSKEDTVFCGVFDGHGPYGHMVAKKVRDLLPLKLSAQWELDATCNGGLNDVKDEAVGYPNSEVTPLMIVNENQGNHADTSITLKESFLKAFKVMDKELKLHPHIDCYFSGTTAVAMVKQGQDLVIGNVGDSRAVLGTRDNDDFLVAVQLTVDLKPNLPSEAERIRLCKGRVFALQNEPGVSRVWLPNNDYPGLAMARAFGDFCLKDFGLISVPEVSHYRLTEKDEFVVLATDGVWDVLSNKEVVDIVAAASKSSAARVLVESAVRAWKFKYPSAKIDDCAVVCLFLDSGISDTCYVKPKEEAVASLNQVDIGSEFRNPCLANDIVSI